MLIYILLGVLITRLYNTITTIVIVNINNTMLLKAVLLVVTPLGTH